MRGLIIVVIGILLASSGFALTGFCTGQYVETGDLYVDGLIQKGDIFEYWCELPEAVEGNDVIEVEFIYTNARLLDAFLVPRPVFGGTMVIFP